MSTTHNNPTNSKPKNFPSATSEVAKMLGLSGSKNEPVSGHGADLPVANLPVVLDDKDHIDKHGHVDLNHGHNENHDLTDETDEKKSSPVALKAAKAVVPYLAVFIVGLVLYYFFFTGFDFGSIINSKPKASTPKQTELQVLASQNLEGFRKWMSGFYYDIRDEKIMDPEADNSGNGLTNFQKYLLKLNPKAFDTLGLGMPDSQVLANGIDPATGMPLTDAQKEIVTKYIDMEVVMNRMTLYRLNHSNSVAGASTNTSNTVSTSPFVNTNVNSPNIQTAPITGANITVGGIELDTNIPGRLEIPSLKINAPIIFTKDPKNFDKDLQIGVVHYPGTALPGQIGTTYISGHSSNVAWAKGDYNYVFSKLGDLADNTSFKITVVQKNGKNAIFHYVVTHRKQYLATDQEQFVNTGKSLVALSTCWPVNTTAKRLVVFGELTQTEK